MSKVKTSIKKAYISYKIMSLLAGGEHRGGLWLYSDEIKKQKVLFVQLELLRIAGVVKRITSGPESHYWLSAEGGV